MNAPVDARVAAARIESLIADLVREAVGKAFDAQTQRIYREAILDWLTAGQRAPFVYRGEHDDAERYQVGDAILVFWTGSEWSKLPHGAPLDAELAP